MYRLLTINLILFVGCQDEGLIAASENLEQTAADVHLEPAEILKKGKELSLTEAERVWELIPWTRSVDEAKKISQETQRPIFLFSMLGDLDGRC